MLSRITRLKLTTAAVLLALLTIFADDVYAEQTIGVAPALVSVKAKKAIKTKYPLFIFNDGPDSLEVKASFFDFRLSPDGHVVFLPGRSAKRTWSAASWLRLSRKRFTLGPNEEKKVWLHVSPPKSAEPGTHRAVITFSTSDSMFDEDTKSEVLVSANVSAVVLVDVAGKTSTKPIINLDIPKINFSDPIANLSLGNTGNVHYFANGDVTFSGTRKATYADFRLKQKPPGAMVLPGAKRDFDFSWKKAPYLGVYRVDAKVKITDGRVMTIHKSFYLIRWQFILAILGSIAFLFLLYLGVKNLKIVKRTDM